MKIIDPMWLSKYGTLLQGLEQFLPCDTCTTGMVLCDGVVECDACGERINPDCPKCLDEMLLRHRSDGSPFWGCTQECKAALPWEGDVKKVKPRIKRKAKPETDEGWDWNEQDRTDDARDILTHPLIAGSAACRKLLELLDEKPDRVIPLVLGEETPGGKPTVEARLKERLRSRKPGKPKRRAKHHRAPKSTRKSAPLKVDPLLGIKFYTANDRPDGPPVLTKRIPEEGGYQAPASVFQHHRLPYETLNPVQTLAHEFVEQDCNLVVAASTSAGKTVVAEMVMADSIEREAKAIFLSPLRAVSQEKYDDWTDLDHPWSELGVSICTGDYMLTDAKKRELRRASVIVMTSEMLDSKTRRMESEENTWLLQTLCLVIDEAHLLTMDGRGDALECGLMRFTQQNPNARIVLLSATMPNVAELGAWLTKLNGKPTRVIESEWRPTTLTVHWPTYQARSGGRSYHINQDSLRKATISLVQSYCDDKWIIFVHSKKAGYKLQGELREMHEEVEFHNADLDKDARQRVSHRFKNGKLRIIIATSTLAYGINMPARRVCVMGINRGLSEVDPIDVKQEVGRAGRVGLDPCGDAYVLLPNDPSRPDRLALLQQKYMTILPIKSTLNDVDTLAFHLVSEVAEGDVETKKEAVAWHDRSLAAFQGSTLAVDGSLCSAARVLDDLAKCGVLSEDAGRYSATMLGRVASWLYYSPFDVAGWCSNFRRLVGLDKTKDDDCIAWALGNVKSAFRNTYLPREHEGDLMEVGRRLRAHSIDGALAPAVLAFQGLITGTDYKGMASVQRQLDYDADRIIQCVKLIDQYVIKGLGKTYCSLLGMRVRYGATWEEAGLCAIPGVGAKRARQLVRAGVTSVAKVLDERGAVIAALGQKTALVVFRGAKDIKRKGRD